MIKRRKDVGGRLPITISLYKEELKILEELRDRRGLDRSSYIRILLRCAAKEEKSEDIMDT